MAICFLWICVPAACASQALVPCEISADQLHGIYPNSRGEGIGQGHLYALNVLAESSSEREKELVPIFEPLWRA